MTRAEKIKVQEAKVAEAARKLRELRSQETQDQRKKRTHTLIQLGAIIEVVGIPLDTSRDIITGAWAKIAEMIKLDAAVLADLAAVGTRIIEMREAGKSENKETNTTQAIEHAPHGDDIDTNLENQLPEVIDDV